MLSSFEGRLKLMLACRADGAAVWGLRWPPRGIWVPPVQGELHVQNACRDFIVGNIMFKRCMCLDLRLNHSRVYSLPTLSGTEAFRKLLNSIIGTLLIFLRSCIPIRRFASIKWSLLNICVLTDLRENYRKYQCTIIYFFFFYSSLIKKLSELIMHNATLNEYDGNLVDCM